MRYLIFVITVVISGCSANQASPFGNRGVDVFYIKGGSYGASADSRYYLFLEDESLPDSLQIRLLNYAYYVLDYRGMHVISAPSEADYYVMVSFRPYDTSSKEQIFQLAAASRKVYEATNDFKPRWWANSTYYGTEPKHNQMLAMHALSVRDFAGKSLGRHQNAVRYRKNDEVVRHVMNKVEQ